MGNNEAIRLLKVLYKNSENMYLILEKGSSLKRINSAIKDMLALERAIEALENQPKYEKALYSACSVLSPEEEVTQQRIQFTKEKVGLL